MSYLRSHIERMQAYVPGEQPRVRGLIKLNTNENPYPPSPKVLRALRTAMTDQNLRRYPDPTALAVRQKIGSLYGFAPDQVFVGNGCDEVLNLAVRAFCGEGEKIAYLQPSYSLYPVLAEIQGAKKNEIPFVPANLIRGDREWLQSREKVSRLQHAKLIFITNPNAPTGLLIPKFTLQKIIVQARGVVLLDEAYMDFADAGSDGLVFAQKYPNVLVGRSFSKSFGLAGMRLGFAVGPKALVEGLMKIKDSYNVNRLGQVAALAALSDLPSMRRNVAKICKTRTRLKATLEKLGFFVYPSQANFVLLRPPQPLTARGYYEALRQRKILVRWFDLPSVREFVRITIGTDGEIEKLIGATKKML